MTTIKIISDEKDNIPGTVAIAMGSTGPN